MIPPIDESLNAKILAVPKKDEGPQYTKKGTLRLRRPKTKNQYFGMDDLIKKMLSQKLKINSYKFSGYWKDIGRPDDYEEAINDFINDPDYFS